MPDHVLESCDMISDFTGKSVLKQTLLKKIIDLIKNCTSIVIYQELCCSIISVFSHSTCGNAVLR